MTRTALSGRARAASTGGSGGTRRASRLSATLAPIILGSLVACSAGGGGGGSGPLPDPEFATYAAGETLAEFEVVAPTTSTFILHGTVPLQPEMVPWPDADTPFVLEDPDGQQYSTQVEVVSRFADEALGADVVEVLARVQRPAGYTPGQRTTYQLKLAPHEAGELDLDADVAALIDSVDNIVLRTRDVFGHTYSARLLTDLIDDSEELQSVRDGEVAREWRTHELLMPDAPVGGDSGTLPHFMGVHSYVGVYDHEAFVTLDLRVHNGGSGADPADPNDDPLGKLYFEDLELVLPQGWSLLTAFDDQTFGTPYNEVDSRVWPIVSELSGGDLHVMPQQAQFHRRLLIARNDSIGNGRTMVEQRGLAFCRPGENQVGTPLMSWWNPATARYMLQKQPMPRLDTLDLVNIRNDLAADLGELSGIVDGTISAPYTWHVPTGNLGWAHPHGLQMGGAHGGHEIFFYHGYETAWAASVEGYRYHQLLHRMKTDRHPVALYNADGRPTCVADWTVDGPQGPYMPVNIWIIPWLPLGDPWGFTSSPSFQRDAVAAQGRKPPYEDALLDFDPLDSEHLVRYTLWPKVLCWLGNDSLAKDDLRMMAELTHMSYTPLAQTADGEGRITTGMAKDRAFVDTHPGEGFEVSRGEGWMIEATTIGYAIGTPAWRASMRPYFDELLELFEDGQLGCTGVLGAYPSMNNLGGLYRTRQSISESILENALWSIRQNVYEGADPQRSSRLRQILRSSLYAMISDLYWNFDNDEVWFYTAVGPFDQEEAPFCGYVPPDGHDNTDAYQGWSSLAYGYRLTGDQTFLVRAQAMADGNFNSLFYRETGILENASGLVGLLQEIEYP